MTKIEIININLGEISKIVEETYVDIEEKTKIRLNAAIKYQKKIDKMRENRQKKITAADQKTINIFEMLQKRRQIPVEELIKIAKPEISTSSALTTRLKTYIRKKEKSYAIKRATINKIPHYVLEDLGCDEDD